VFLFQLKKFSATRKVLHDSAAHTPIWFLVISMEDLSTACPVLVSMTFVLVTFSSVFFFRGAYLAAEAHQDGCLDSEPRQRRNPPFD